MNSKIALSECKLYPEYMNQLRLTKQILDRLQERKEKLAEPATVCFTDEPKVRSLETGHTRMVYILNEERIYKNYANYYATKIQTIRLLIDAMPDEVSEIMKAKYIYNRKWDDLEMRFGYTKDNMIKKIHRALAKSDFEML